MATGFPHVDPVAFHRVELPNALAAGRAALAGVGARGRAPLALRVDGGPAFTYASAPSGITVHEGDDDAATVVGLDGAAFTRFVHELQTAPGLLYAGALDLERGTYLDLDGWEPALRAAWHGRPVYDPVALGLVHDGRPTLNLYQSFTLDDGDEVLAAALARRGYLHLRGVLGADEVDALLDEVDRLAADAVEGDRRSWWAGAGGERVLVRLTYLGMRSERFRSLGDDPRIRRLHALAGAGLELEVDHSDGTSVVMKHGGATDGLADLPWHVDCGLGGHPLLCPSVAVGVQLVGACETTARMRFLAGSHATSAPRLGAGAGEDGLPIATLDTEPGDCTVHFGHVLHQAPPPGAAGPGRRTCYLTAAPAGLRAHVGPGRGYNDVLFRADGSVPSVEQLV